MNLRVYIRFHLFASGFQVKIKKIRSESQKIKTKLESSEKEKKNPNLPKTGKRRDASTALPRRFFPRAASTSAQDHRRDAATRR